MRACGALNIRFRQPSFDRSRFFFRIVAKGNCERALMSPLPAVIKQIVRINRCIPILYIHRWGRRRLRWRGRQRGILGWWEEFLYYIIIIRHVEYACRLRVQNFKCAPSPDGDQPLACLCRVGEVFSKGECRGGSGEWKSRLASLLQNSR